MISAGRAVTRRSRIIGILGALVAAALIAMKLLPWVPGSFGKFEYIALGAWALLGLILWQRRGRVS